MSLSNDQIDVSAVAALYDQKTRDEGGLNALLAGSDLRFFNHNGLIVPPRSPSDTRPLDENSRLSLLHELEMDLVAFGLDYVGHLGPGDTVLDAGCGAGGGGLMMHGRFGCSVEGVTLSPEQARFANRAAEMHEAADRVRFRVADMRALPPAPARYDAIWACESTEHIGDLEALFTLFAGLLQPEGRIVIIAWCAGTGDEANALKQRIDDHYLTVIHTPDAYVKAAEAAGLKLADHADLTEMTTPYWRMRESSEHATGSERFMGDGYAQRLVTYELFALQA